MCFSGRLYCVFDTLNFSAKIGLFCFLFVSFSFFFFLFFVFLPFCHEIRNDQHQHIMGVKIALLIIHDVRVSACEKHMRNCQMPTMKTHTFTFHLNELTGTL